jgi:hypothetical protein
MNVMEDFMKGQGQGKLALCECGKLHFTYGSVTLHFEREEFFLFAEAVGRLSAMLKQTPHGSPLSVRPANDVRICH